MSTPSQLEPDRRRRLCRIVVLVHDFSRAVSDDLEQRLGPSLSQNSTIVVLTDLAGSGSRRPRDLSRLLGLTSGGTSNLLDRLELAGLVVRQRSASTGDHRAVLVELTASGRRAEAALTQVLMESMQRAAVVLKETLMTLEHLGARPRRSVGHAASTGHGSRLVMALAGVGIQLSRALDTPSSDFSTSLLLMAIDDVGACRPRYLAERLVLTSAVISKRLDRLQALGLVERSGRDDPSDRRAVFVDLTADGARLVDSLLVGVVELLDDLAGALVDVGTALSVVELD